MRPKISSTAVILPVCFITSCLAFYFYIGDKLRFTKPVIATLASTKHGRRGFNPTLKVATSTIETRTSRPSPEDEERPSKEELFNRIKQAYQDIVAEERLTALSYACRRHGVEDDFSLAEVLRLPQYKRPRLYYSDQYKLLLCEVPKCASKNWRKALLVMENEANGTSNPEEISDEFANEFGVNRLLWNQFDGKDAKSVREMAYRIYNYTRVITVRDPLQRLISAYKDKMLPNGTGGERYGNISKKIHRLYKDQNDTKAMENPFSGYASWFEFVRYLVDPKRRVMMDPHWMPFTDMCDPCRLRYHYIAKLDTMTADVSYISNKIKFDLTPFFSGKSKYEHMRREERWKGEYPTYYKQLASSMTKELFAKYESQYELFGYSKPYFIT